MALPLSYNWRNLFVRKLSTALTFTVVSVVVLVLAVLLSFTAGIQASLNASGRADNLLVLKPGATAESTSILSPEEIAKLSQTPGVARDAAGTPLLSPEMCVQASLPRRGPEALTANVAVRGVDDAAFAVHTEVRLVEGQRFSQGAMEVIVGKAARERFANFDLGREIAVGRSENRVFKIVGVFEAGGSALESEVWGPRTMLADAYRRTLLSSAVLRLENMGQMTAACDYVNGPAVKLRGKSELDYYGDLADKTRQIVFLAGALVVIMAIGAVFAVANTMYAAVDGRRREIAMLRTIGFSRRSIITAFVIESVLLCTLACLCGLGATMLWNYWNGTRQDFLSDTTWTVLAFETRVTPAVFITALLLGIMVGVAGALAPALRASRIRIIDALRKA